MDREKSKSRLLNRAITLNPDAPEVLNAEDAEESEKEQAQGNVHQFILSEFKEKYDQLKSQFESKKR